jgi:hypothetical protein
MNASELGPILSIATIGGLGQWKNFYCLLQSYY